MLIAIYVAHTNHNLGRKNKETCTNTLICGDLEGSDGVRLRN